MLVSKEISKKFNEEKQEVINGMLAFGTQVIKDLAIVLKDADLQDVLKFKNRHEELWKQYRQLYLESLIDKKNETNS